MAPVLISTTMQPRIVITDDDPGVQEIFKIIFEKAGYLTTIFSSGAQILRNDYKLPDVFLLDKQLSGMDGLDICRYLKNNPRTKDIPVIMASATPGIGKMAMEAGADDFIEKPFVTRFLLEKVSAVLNKAAIA
ncbi:MAG: response regulator [Chitinophagaceae bacterium]